MNKVYIGFGSNKGDKLNFIQNAVNAISANKKIKVLKSSSLYETKPYGNVPQGNFLNGVLLVETNSNLNELFVFLKDLEIKIGRTPSERWGPREIDLDILVFGDTVQMEGEVIVPHIGITQRDFVLKPLLELNPDLQLPGTEIKIKEIDLSQIEENVLNKLSHKITY